MAALFENKAWDFCLELGFVQVPIFPYKHILMVSWGSIFGVLEFLIKFRLNFNQVGTNNIMTHVLVWRQGE